MSNMEIYFQKIIVNGIKFQEYIYLDKYFVVANIMK